MSRSPLRSLQPRAPQYAIVSHAILDADRSIVGYSTEPRTTGRACNTTGDHKCAWVCRPLFWSDKCDTGHRTQDTGASVYCGTESISRPACECAIASMSLLPKWSIMKAPDGHLLQLLGAGRRAESPRNPKSTGYPSLWAHSGVTSDAGIVRERYVSPRTCTRSRGPLGSLGPRCAQGPYGTPENAGD